MRISHLVSFHHIAIARLGIALFLVSAVEQALADSTSILVPDYRPVDAPTTPWKVFQRFLRGRPRDAKLSDYEPLSKEKPLKEPLPPPMDTSGITVAIYGDSGMNVDAQRVFRAAREDADMVLHVGDFAYEFAGANEFNTAISSIFGNAFPYVTTIGDHDMHEFGTYRDFFTARDRNTPGLECEGKWGYASVCRYKGIVFFGMGIKFQRMDYDGFLQSQLPRYRDWPWKICFWHRVDSKFQPGRKMDNVGTRFYDLCREHGAMIITGHEHQYGRSHTLISFKRPEQSVIRMISPATGSQKVQVGQGRSFLAVSGLAGGLPRGWNARRAKDPWWAAFVSKQNMNSFGCLYCTFRVGGDIRKAHCEFRDISGVVWDRFEIESLPELEKKIEYSKKNSGKEEVSLTTPIKKHDLFAFICGAAFSWYRLYLQKEASKLYQTQCSPALNLERNVDLAQHIHDNYDTASWNLFVRSYEHRPVPVAREDGSSGSGMESIHTFRVGFNQDQISACLHMESLRIRRVSLQLTGYSSEGAPSSKWWNPSTWRKYQEWLEKSPSRRDDASPFEVKIRPSQDPDALKKAGSFPRTSATSSHSVHSALRNSRSATSQMRSLFFTRTSASSSVAPKKFDKSGSASTRTGKISSSNTILWSLSKWNVMEASTKAVWVSPDLTGLLQDCIRRRSSCLWELSTTNEQVAAMLRYSLSRYARVPPRMVVEYHKGQTSECATSE